MYDIFVGTYTDAGDSRTTNQDSILEKIEHIGNHTVGMFIVADGCGGLAYGEEISKLTVMHFNRLWDTEMQELFSHGDVSELEISDFLERVIRGINEESVSFGKQVGKRVGTTLSLLFTVDKKYYIKNIGDSRIYLIRKKRISQITEDQSLVASMIRNKEMTIEEAKKFKSKNVLIMCIGLFDEIKTFTRIGRIKNNDIFLICCDGLYNGVPEGAFKKLLVKPSEKEMNAIAKSLRDSIPQGCAKDNVSVILVKFRGKGIWRRWFCI